MSLASSTSLMVPLVLWFRPGLLVLKINVNMSIDIYSH